MNTKLVVMEPTVKVDDGLYDDAKAAGVSAGRFLVSQEQAPQEWVDAAKETLARKCGGKKLNNDVAEDWAQERAALANQLSWYEQKTGKPIITVHDFYHTDNAVTSLFPAWLESEIQATLISTGLVPWLIMGSEAVNSTQVTGLYDSSAASERSLRKITEGAELPSVTLTLADSIVYLNKFGRRVESSYEALARQNINALGAHFSRMVQQVAVDETDLALHTLVAGDGTTAGAAESNATDRDVAVAGAIAYTDLINWFLDFDAPYQMDKAVGGDVDLALIMNLAEFKDATFAGNAGNLPGPKQVNFQRWEGSVAGSSYLSRMIIGIDSRYALRKYTYGGMIQESGNIIRQQLKEFTFSYYSGFRKFDANACVILDVNAVL